MALTQAFDLEFRLYDGTAVTPHYVVGVFQTDATPDMLFPIGYGHGDETLYQDRGQFTPNASFVPGPDTAGQPIGPIQFTWLLDAAQSEMIAAWGNPGRIDPWTVGGQTLVPVTAIGQRENGRGVLTDCQLPGRLSRRKYLMDAYISWGAPPAGGNDVIWMAQGFSANPESYQFSVQGNVVQVTADVLFYGQIGPVASFPVGTEVTPA